MMEVSHAAGRAMPTPTVVALEDEPAVEQPRWDQDNGALPTEPIDQKTGELSRSSEITASRRAATPTVAAPRTTVVPPRYNSRSTRRTRALLFSPSVPRRPAPNFQRHAPASKMPRALLR